jgi:hypothetical protein
MTRHTILFSFLAISLAAFSLSMAPRHLPAPSVVATAYVAPGHALTGVSFRAMSVGY